MLDKKYDHIEVEKNKYENWKSKGYFNSGDLSKKPYSIVIPPPNVTGKLHIGHAYNVAIQDAIIRFKRMQGYDCLWLPGMDHAAIATEAKVVKKLKEQGIDKYEYGREKFLNSCWDWTHEYGGSIRNQWAAMGISVDYNKERFTLDDGLNKAVTKVFVDYYNKGLIYRGEKIINWDPVAKTALSNEEVIYKNVEGAFYHLKYIIEGTNDYLDVATTRPETLFGDTALAVNPEDDRYKDLIGKNVILPIVNKLIPIIGDSHADMEKGTGVVKITPAHDPNDFEVGNRHNLERIVIMNDDATMNENCPLKYQGMTREDARKVLLEDLKNKDLLLEIEPLNHEVGHSERTGVMVEPMIKKQWFVKMRKLADNVLENQKNKDTKVNFVPEYYEKTMNHWMEITYDWCISRQLWWGHRIPAWYKDEEVYVGMDAPKEAGWVQDQDVLDTWFSSALWPFSTLGWPEKTIDMERYFPNDCLVTAYDIIPFWVNRMTFQSLELNNIRPFKDCIIHGLIRDKDGRKMSKSLGNGVDPFDMIEKYGVDALRFYLTTDCALGTDLRFDETKMSSTWNFINKLWNASRFVLMNIEDIKEATFDNLSISDKWILTKMNRLIENITKHMEKYEFNIVGSELYSFIWNDFCDWYIELSKSDMSNTNKSVLLLVLTNILKMLHPFMPFVTEEIYMMLPIKDSDSIMISNYPTINNYIFNDEKETMDKIIEDIVSIRNLKAINNITKNAYINYEIEENYKDIYVKQLKLDKHEYVKDSNLPNINYKSKYITINYYEQKESNNEFNLEEINKLKASIERREKLLSNENYVNKAPANIVEMDRKKLEEEKEKLRVLENK
ncbi:MAG: valine--tRNA ligase [Bacilli bacterium]|nr:valine--tRNA ligase [Bacilli bacterium]MBP3445601.1 valine--tRNA ligase [Bacilli bacterium]